MNRVRGDLMGLVRFRAKGQRWTNTPGAWLLSYFPPYGSSDSTTVDELLVGGYNLKPTAYKATVRE